MKEAEWLSWPDPYDLLEQCLICELTERKLRLFACACCRRLWHLLEDSRLRVAIEVAERYAVAEATGEELQDARKRADDFLAAYGLHYWADAELINDDTDLADLNDEERDAIRTALERRCDGEDEKRWAVRHAAEAVVAASSRDADEGKPYLHHTETVIMEASQAQASFVGWHAERQFQANLLRDIFGNPFRPVTFVSTWKTPLAMTLAKEIYDQLAWDRMPGLADALAAGGCHDAEILSHCRIPNGHAPGCWVIDAILGHD